MPTNDELLRQIEEYKASDRMKQDLLDASVDMIMRCDTNLRILWANKTAAAQLNKPVDEIIGQKCHSIFQELETPCPGCPCLKALKTGHV